MMNKRIYVRYKLIWLVGILLFLSQTGCGRDEVVFFAEENVNQQQESVEESVSESTEEEFEEEQQLIQVYI